MGGASRARFVGAALAMAFGVAIGLLWWETVLDLREMNPYPYSIVAVTLFLGAFMVCAQGPRASLIFLLVVLAIPFGSEFPGVLTGIPFGPYHYTDAPGPKVLGIVPLFILLAWVAIIYPVVATTTVAMGRGGLALAVVDGAAATAWDAMVDPLAVRANFWAWHDPGPFYGIPWTNFLGWFLVVAASSAVVRRLSPRPPAESGPPRVLALLPPLLLLMLCLKYALLAFARGFPLAALVGVAGLLPFSVIAMVRLRGPPTPPGLP